MSVEVERDEQYWGEVPVTVTGSHRSDFLDSWELAQGQKGILVPLENPVDQEM